MQKQNESNLKEINSKTLQTNNKRIEQHIEKNYELSQTKVIKSVGGYFDSNYLISCLVQNDLKTIKCEKKYIVKVSHPSAEKMQLQIQNSIIQYLSCKSQQIKKSIGEEKFSNQYFQIVKLIPSKSGSLITNLTQLEINQTLFLRVFQFVQNSSQFADYDQTSFSEAFFEQVGRKTANLVKVMQGFPYKTTFQELQITYKNAKNIFQQSNQFKLWNLSCFDRNKQDLKYVKDQESLKIIEKIFADYQEIREILKSLPQQITHSDICQTNVLLGKKLDKQNVQQVYAKTVIDFGDVQYTASFYELIIACARQVICKEDPLRNMIAVIKGYFKTIKLDESLIKIVYPLVMARLATIYINSQKSVVLCNQQDECNLNYLVQTRNSVKHYVVTYAKYSQQQFSERLFKDLHD